MDLHALQAIRSRSARSRRGLRSGGWGGQFRIMNEKFRMGREWMMGEQPPASPRPALMRRHVKRSVWTDTAFPVPCVSLLSALVMDPLVIRCMLGSVAGCCHLQRGLFHGA
jgi:hypothetical protein